MLSDKVIVVTGGGHGLGDATAIELGSLGATVVVNDLGASVTGEGESTEPAEETAEAVREAGGQAMAHFGDVSDLDYTEQLVADTVDEYGRVDGVVNFAGILADSISYKMTADEWDRVIRVHLRGHFALLRNVGAQWRERAGDGELDTQRSFLCISSRAAYGNIGQINYSTAKAGILGMMRSAAKELNLYNVRVNALIPSGYTRMIDQIPEGQRPIEPEDMPREKVAPIVGYVMSDEAEDVTGCTLRAIDDAIGIMAEPEADRVAFNEGGWSAEDIAERFRETVGRGQDLERVGDMPF